MGTKEFINLILCMLKVDIYNHIEKKDNEIHIQLENKKCLKLQINNNIL